MSDLIYKNTDDLTTFVCGSSGEFLWVLSRLRVIKLMGRYHYHKIAWLEIHTKYEGFEDERCA